MSKSKLLRGTVILTGGRMAGYGLSFLRNLILARMLAKADYGLAAAFGMALTVLEVSGSLAFGTQVIQSKHGETAAFQGSAHALQFVGGLCSALAIASVSVPMARLFGVPQTAWAFALLAVVPLCQGLGHLDYARRQRDLDYLPLILSDVVPQFLITVAVWPLARWMGDYRVIVWLMIAKAVLGVGMTFALSRRPYRWAWHPDYIRSMATFGWPLLLTGWVMFICQQADQMLVGSVFSLSVLANYALTASVVSIPWFIFSQVGSSLALPIMARAQDDPERLRQQYRVCIQTAAVAGIVCVLPLMVGGEQVIILLFGAKYHGAGPFVAFLGAGFAIRFLRFAPMVAATARADTMNSFYSNLCRGASLPLALGVVALGGSPVEIAACAMVGEVLAAIASVARLSRCGVPLRDSYSASLYLVALVTLGVGGAFLSGAKLSIWLSLAAAGGALFLALLTAWFIFPELRSSLIEIIRKKSVVGRPQPAAT